MELEYDTVLIVDSDAVFPLPLAFQCFKMITRRRLKVLQDFCTVQIIELSYSDLKQGRREPFALARYIELPGIFIGKADDHEAHYNT